MTWIYMYRLSADTGLAPCVKDGLLSLAVCKGGQIRKGKPINTGLRYKIGKAYKDNCCEDKVYLLGTYHNKFLYLARITDVITMEEYYQKKSFGRTDNIYKYCKGQLIRNNYLVNEGIHIGDQINRDLAGKYVLISDDYIYLGRDAVYNDLINDFGAKNRETKTFNGEKAESIIRECEKYRDDIVHIPHNPFQNKCGGCK